MIASEVNAVFDLVLKASSFCTQLKDGWYKGCSELDGFESKVLMLSAKHSQWSEQLRRYGITEDRHLLLVVKLAEQALEKQQESIRKLQNSPLRRLKKRVFPGELSTYLNEVLKIVDAGPQLLATKLANNDLLERYAAHTPTSLPFGRDTNYVPIVSSILEVQRALESAETARVVTVHGGPGLGKSCLAKHVAIHYVEEKQRLEMDHSSENPAVFPDGVFYLLCGPQADKRIKQLQLELLQSLGFQTADAAPIDSATSSGVEAEYTPLPSHQMKLRSCLAVQKLLIILDDLWEDSVLQQVLVPAKGVKYLITSQKRDIFIPATKIQIRTPTDVEARSIMANYTDGLPIPGQFPLNIQRVTDDIIRKLEHHPLSLANIGISINSSRATHTNQWEVISDNPYVHLDENETCRPPAYDSTYSLPVSASMMLMVESLPSEARRLLFLMTLLGGQRLPEPLVKYFYKFIQKTGFAVKYNSQEKFLEDRSLIENFRVGENMLSLDCHSLSWRYIRDKKTDEVRSLASQILIASGSQDIVMPIEKGDTEETLVTVLGSMYYDSLFKDVIRSTFENHVKILNGGVIPWSLNGQWTGTSDYLKDQTLELVCLLNDDHEDGDWKNQAHEYAKKIIIKYACKGKLDDSSMASLLKHPHTTSVACKALRTMYYICHGREFWNQNITFSSTYPEIMETVLSQLYDNGLSIIRRSEVMFTLLYILDFESKDTILKVAAKYRAILATDSRPESQVLMINIFEMADYRRGPRIFAGCPGLLEDLMGVLLFGKDHDVRLSAAHSINIILRGSRRLTLRVAAFPNALQGLFDLFVSQNMFVANDRLQLIAGEILTFVASIPENRSKFKELQGILDGLGAILVKLEEPWRKTRDYSHRLMLERRALVAASILGNLGLEKDLRDGIASLPGVREGLLFLQFVEVARHSRMDPFYWTYWGFDSTQALTILYSDHNPTEPLCTYLPPSEEALEITRTNIGIVGEFDEGPGSMLEWNYFNFYWSRVLACIQMGSYVEACSNFARAQGHLHNFLVLPHQGQIELMLQFWGMSNWLSQRVSYCWVFLRTTQEDYVGALKIASKLYDLTQIGVVKRLSGDLQGALDNLNIQATNLENNIGRVRDGQKLARTLKQRGYVKYLMDDITGARKDAELAQQMIVMHGFEGLAYWSPQQYLCDLSNRPLSYLGYSFDWY